MSVVLRQRSIERQMLDAIGDLYLALATLAFGFVLENIVRNSDWLGGPQGLTGFDITFFGASFDDPVLLFWVGLAFLYLFIVIIASIRRSKLGRGLMATRESPIAARSIGRNLLDLPERTRLPGVERTIGDDAQQPGCEGPARLERIELQQRRQERVLNDVLGVLSLAEQPVGHRKRALHVTTDERVERLIASL